MTWLWIPPKIEVIYCQVALRERDKERARARKRERELHRTRESETARQWKGERARKTERYRRDIYMYNTNRGQVCISIVYDTHIWHRCMVRTHHSHTREIYGRDTCIYDTHIRHICMIIHHDTYMTLMYHSSYERDIWERHIYMWYTYMAHMYGHTSWRHIFDIQKRSCKRYKWFKWIL